MPRKLLIVNAILIAIAAGSVVFIVRQMMAPMPLPARGRSAPAAGAAAPTAGAAPRPAGAYTAVASKNLFSPTRTEAPVSPVASTAVANTPKPNLYGVVLREGAPIAYLEDPATKRVSGYRVGDAVAGGTVQAITADTVSIDRPDGKLDVRLRDPGKPRPAATPGAPPVATPALPGVIPPATPPVAAAPVPGKPAPAAPAQPGVVQPPGVPTPVIPGRRPLPPNLLRRLPQTPQTDAPQQ